jgi:ankyrin repeat protein
MKKIALLLFLSIHSHIYPMMSIAEQKFYIPATLCAILEQKIFTIPSLCCACSCLKDAAVTINALAKTNTFFNKSINEDDKTLALIKQLSQQFDCPNIDVARVLCTKAANNRYTLQRSFLVGWNHSWDSVKNDINKLKRIGLDLNFSYKKTHPTPLIQTVAWQEVGYSNIACWLIENGADITCCTPDGRNASMIALANYNVKLIDTLIDHPAFSVNHQDIFKNTPLHCCFSGIFCGICASDPIYKGIMDQRFSIVYKIITKLLEKGANPTVINTDGDAPLDLAKESRYQPLIELLEKAIADFNSKKSVNGVL